ncbi:MAG: hypothetical protein ABIK28_18045 [Planctomycetota bacterium]
MDDQDIFAFNPDDATEGGGTVRTTDADTSDLLSREVDASQKKSHTNSSSLKDLVKWTSKIEGVEHVIVTDEEGSFRAGSSGASEEASGVFGMILAYSEKCVKSLSLASPYGIEVFEGENRKMIALKLKSGYICVIADNLVEVSDLIDHVKNRPTKEDK